MGERLMPASPMNAKGFFVDLDFEDKLDYYNIDYLPEPNERMPQKLEDIIVPLILTREKLGTTWGIKSIFGCVLLPLLLEHCNEVKVIRTRRPKESSIASLARYTEHSAEKNQSLIEWSLACVDEAQKLAETLEVSFDDLIDSPEKGVTIISDFVGKSVTQDALSFVDASMRTY